MAIVKINEDYQIYIDVNRDHEARVDLHKSYFNKQTGQEIKQYRSIGHYSNIETACEAIYKDMNIKKADEKEFVTVLEWIDIIKDNKKNIKKLMENMLTE